MSIKFVPLLHRLYRLGLLPFRPPRHRPILPKTTVRSNQPRQRRTFPTVHLQSEGIRCHQKEPSGAQFQTCRHATFIEALQCFTIFKEAPWRLQGEVEGTLPAVSTDLKGKMTFSGRASTWASKWKAVAVQRRRRLARKAQPSRTLNRGKNSALWITPFWRISKAA